MSDIEPGAEPGSVVRPFVDQVARPIALIDPGLSENVKIACHGPQGPQSLVDDSGRRDDVRECCFSWSSRSFRS
jgi:hypothetical protein